MSNSIPTCITEYSGSLEGKKVIVRAALNVPLQDGQVDNDFRIKKLFPTLQYLQEHGAIIIIISHIGRDPEETLEPVSDYLADHFDQLCFYKYFFDAWGKELWDENIYTLDQDLSRARNGDILFLDNIRQTKAEKANDVNLARDISSRADFFVHEAFPVAHREHVSTFGVPLLFARDKKFSGVTFHVEHETLNKLLNPEPKSLFVLGGAKFKTKLPLIEAMLPLYDHVFVGGALVNNIYQLLGYEIGLSLVEELDKEQEDSLLLVTNSNKFILPEYVTCETSDGLVATKHISEIKKNEKIYDIHPNSFRHIFDNKNIRSIVWNGPLGYYENNYVEGSKELAQLIGTTDSFSVAGGGDTIDAIFDTHEQDNFSFLSTAGGAMIDYLADGELPGVSALIS